MRHRLSISLAGLACVALALLLLLAVYVPYRVLHPPHAPITRTPDEVGLEYQDVRLEATDGTGMRAAWWMPAADARAAVVFVHGGGSNRHTPYFRALGFYRAMVERNIAVLTLDLRGHGASSPGPEPIRFGAGAEADLHAGLAWVRARHPELPLYAMGISLGGSVAIRAALTLGEEELQGLILHDPLLDTRSAFVGGAHAVSALPRSLLEISALSAQRFFGFPSGEREALALGRQLALPTLLIQSPGDPVNLAVHAQALAEGHPDIELWLTPEVAADHPKLAWKAGWGSHVGAFELFPEATLARIQAFVERTRPAETGSPSEAPGP